MRKDPGDNVRKDPGDNVRKEEQPRRILPPTGS